MFFSFKKKVSIDPKVGQVLCRITWQYWSHLYGQTPTEVEKKQKLGSSLILHGDIPVQTKLFVSEHKQRKVCLSVESKDLSFSCRVAKGSTNRNGAGENKKTNISIKQEFFLWRAASQEKRGSYASQVQSHLTGDRPAWCYTLGSLFTLPNNTHANTCAHLCTETHTQTPKQQELVKVKNRGESMGGKEKVGR